MTRAYYLGGDRGAAPIKVRTEAGRTILDIERPIPDPMASVVVESRPPLNRTTAFGWEVMRW